MNFMTVYLRAPLAGLANSYLRLKLPGERSSQGGFTKPTEWITLNVGKSSGIAF
ncbi:MAG: hypothetical protein JWM59_1237 [Verrucomicrobiales bacterium]|nr:hypothetical protein [Verrucomicrobiales bacterium]